MAWIKEIVMAGIITVIACAGIFELLERRKREAFKEQIHNLAQKYIDKMKQEEEPRKSKSTRSGWVMSFALSCPMVKR